MGFFEYCLEVSATCYWAYMYVEIWEYSYVKYTFTFSVFMTFMHHKTRFKWSTSTGSIEFLSLLGFVSWWAWAEIILGLGLVGNIGLGCRSTTLNDLWGNEYSLYFNDVNSNTSFQHIVTGLMQPQWCNFNMSFIWCLFFFLYMSCGLRHLIPITALTL